MTSRAAAPPTHRHWVLAALLTITALAGCAPDISPIPNALPTPKATASPARSLPSATGTWTSLSQQCPNLDSPTARTLGVQGEGRPTPEYFRRRAIYYADCEWHPGYGHSVAVRARVSIYPRREGAEAGWRILAAGSSPQQLPGLGQETINHQESSTTVVVRVLSNNAVLTVRLILPRVPAPDEAARQGQLHELESQAQEITRDVLDDLR